jgi:hypothetical protein
MQPKIPVKLTTTNERCEFPGYMTKIQWRSVDTQLHNWVGRELQSVLPIKELKNSFMIECNILAVWVPGTHKQQLLTLWWCSFSRWGKEGVVLTLQLKAVMVLESTKVLGDNRMMFRVVWNEWCYRRAETWREAEEAVRWPRPNLVRWWSGLRCCDVERGGVIILITRWVDGV